MMSQSVLVRGILLILATGILSIGSVVNAAIEIDDFIVMFKTVEGPVEKELKGKAELEAVRSSVGRLYFSERLILAEELLEKYLENSFSDFISESRLIKREEKKDNIIHQWRVVVNFAKLKADMEEKRFLYEPRYRPYFSVIYQMKESGRPTRNNAAREQIIRIMNENGLRVLKKDFQKSINWQSELTEVDQAKMKEVLIAGQKAGIELIVTGSMNVIDRGSQSIYLVDNFYYTDVEADIKLVRINDGTVLFSHEESLKVTERSKEEADKLAIKTMTETLSAKVVELFSPAWQQTYLDQADYQVMLTNVSQNDLEIVQTLIESMAGYKFQDTATDEETLVFPKSYLRGKFSDVAVISVVYKGPVENLIQRMTNAQYPRLVLRDFEKNQIALEQVQ